MTIEEVRDIIAEVAAAEIMPRFKKLAAGDIEMKAVNDPVTVADRAAEQALAARLKTIAPGSVVVGEESFAADPGIFSHFGGDSDVWVIDPIDGTRNFIAGKPEFGVMVARVRRRETVAAWIHDPNSGDTLMAEKGGGVWMNGARMRLAAREDAGAAGLIGARFGRLVKKPEIAAALGNRMPVMQTGSAAAFDYGRLFAGSALFGRSAQPRAAFLLYRGAKPWDHVPGLFMLAEEGGYAADLQGKPYKMEALREGLLAASSREAWEEIHAALKPAIDILMTL